MDGATVVGATVGATVVGAAVVDGATVVGATVVVGGTVVVVVSDGSVPGRCITSATPASATAGGSSVDVGAAASAVEPPDSTRLSPAQAIS